MTLRFPKIDKKPPDRKCNKQSAFNRGEVHKSWGKTQRADRHIFTECTLDRTSRNRRWVANNLRRSWSSRDKSDKIGGLCTEGAELGRGALTYCDRVHQRSGWGTRLVANNLRRSWSGGDKSDKIAGKVDYALSALSLDGARWHIVTDRRAGSRHQGVTTVPAPVLGWYLCY